MKPALAHSPTSPGWLPGPVPAPAARLLRLAAAACALALTACGGGGGSGGGGSAATCTVAEENAWLQGHFADTYFWNALAPRPSPVGYTSSATYFSALLYQGGDAIPGGANGATWPRDRWSGYQSTESFDQFYGEGQTLGYGVAVAGLEVKGQPAQPLLVRQVDPGSPAGLAGVQRGDRVLALNGRAASEVIAADDFSALTASAAGQQLVLQLRRGSTDLSVTLAAALYTLTPVPEATVLTTPGGRKVGYLRMSNFISQALSPLETGFAQFRAQGVQSVVLDLRYNGGGLVSVSSTLGGYLGGARAAGKVFASLVYNPQQASRNTTYRFASPAPASAVESPRVYVLMGRRTCSASELVINGLRGAGLDVVTVGETSCGKPVGFQPTDQCGKTWSIVNFESVNALGQGRYFDGLAATCAVAEDFTQPLASAGDPLARTALAHADSGSCGPVGARATPLYRRSAADAPEPGERRGMMP